jgi:hypothetical protein
MPILNWAVSKTDGELLIKVAHKAVHQFPAFTVRNTYMDLTACHANGCPLDLQALLDAADINQFDFTHDILGIRQHLDRQTGKLKDCFVPRYAKIPRYANAKV